MRQVEAEKARADQAEAQVGVASTTKSPENKLGRSNKMKSHKTQKYFRLKRQDDLGLGAYMCWV